MTDHHQDKQRRELLSDIGAREFVVLMAALMALQALSIDMMLPALPQMGHDLKVAAANDRQAIILLFFLGVGLGSLLMGPLSDRYGRRPILIGAIMMMMIATIVCALAPTYPVMLMARLSAGLCGAACRVVTISIVRDCFKGDEMARIMSLIFMVFIIVPALAPGVGQLVLLVGPWRTIFATLAILIGLAGVWAMARLPETLRPENRAGVRAGDIVETFRTVITNRGSIGHMLASGFMLSGMMSFIVSIQQIFFDIFHRPDLFPYAFGVMALSMGMGNLFNSQLVERFGARRMSQSAVIALIVLSAIRLALVVLNMEGLVMFVVLQGLTMMCVSLSGANLGSISMEPFSRGAGLASSVQAALTTVISMTLGGLVGALFDGTLLPISIGFLVFGLCALLSIAWAERWKLFQRPGLAHLRRGAISPPR
jgi:MFS transporter, DHA1 family, multidrug resistance protein